MLPRAKGEEAHTIWQYHKPLFRSAATTEIQDKCLIISPFQISQIVRSPFSRILIFAVVQHTNSECPKY
jgi:hypothetical protein